MKYKRMKRKLFIPLFVSLTILSVFIACQETEILDKTIDWKAPVWNNAKDREAIAEARQWYNLHREEIDAVMTRSATHPLLGDMEPIWKQTYTRKTDRYTSVESYLRAYSGLHFVAPDAKQKSEATGDTRYLLSLTRLIQLKYQDGREMIGFFMTLSPSAKYFEATKFRPFYSTYAHRDKHYDGYVLYHNLQGRFVNGWKYTDGKITQSLKPKPDSLLPTRGSMLVCLPVYEFHCEEQEGYVDEEGTPTAVSKCGEMQVGEQCFYEEIPGDGDGDGNNNQPGGNEEDGGGLGGGGGGHGTNKPGEYQPEEPTPKPDTPITPANFMQMVMTAAFKNLILQKLGVQPNVPFTFIENGCSPTSNAQYYNKENRINICPSFFERNYKLADVQSIVFHEYVHVLQFQDGRYPAQNPDGSFVTTTYTFLVGVDEVNDAWGRFYQIMDDNHVPRENRTEGQQRSWDQYKSDMVDPEIQKQQNGETYTREHSYELIQSEIEAYGRQIQEYGSQMSPEVLKQQQDNLETQKKTLNKINNRAIK